MTRDAVQTTEITGRCLCGAVSVRLQRALPAGIGVCHCNICRRWGGGPMFAVEGGAETRFETRQPDDIAVYASSEWAERGFCRHCGTHLFCHILQPGLYEIPVGLFDPQTNFELQAQIFVEQKPAFYAFTNKTHMLTGAEVFAMAAARQKQQDSAG